MASPNACRYLPSNKNGIQVHGFLKLLPWLLAGIGTLLAVLAALLYFVDVNLYRDRIAQQISTAFGREVVLEGYLSL